MSFQKSSGKIRIGKEDEKPMKSKKQLWNDHAYGVLETLCSQGTDPDHEIPCCRSVVAMKTHSLSPQEIVKEAGRFHRHFTPRCDPELLLFCADALRTAVSLRTAARLPDSGQKEALQEKTSFHLAFARSAALLASLFSEGTPTRGAAFQKAYLKLCQDGLRAACSCARTRVYEQRSSGWILIRPLIQPPEIRAAAVKQYDALLERIKKEKKDFIPDRIERTAPDADLLLTVQQNYDLAKKRAAGTEQLDGTRFNKLFGSRG